MTDFAMTFCAVALFGCLFGMLIPQHRTEQSVRLVLSLFLLLLTVRLAVGASAEFSVASWDASVPSFGWQDETAFAVASAVREEADAVLSAQFQCCVSDAEVDLFRENGTPSVAEIRLYCSVVNDEILQYIRDYLGTDRVVLIPRS